MSRCSRYERPRKATRMIFTERDGEIVRDLLLLGPLRRVDIQKLRFTETEKGKSRCQLRLTLLYRNRWIDKLPDRPVNAPDIYFVSSSCSRGIRYLDQRLGSEEVRRRLRTPGQVEHRLMVNECRIALSLGAKALGFELLDWLDEIDLAAMGAEVGFVPDAYFKVRRSLAGGPKTAAFFLEAERTARSASAVESRLSRYRDYYRSGLYAARFGTRALRVLMVLSTNESSRPARRLSGLIKRAEALGASFFYFTTLEEFREAQPQAVLSAPIWRTPSQDGKVALFST